MLTVSPHSQNLLLEIEMTSVKAHFFVHTGASVALSARRPGVYLDALLEIAEMLDYEGLKPVPVSSVAVTVTGDVTGDVVTCEFGRRLAQLHRRLFDLSSRRGQLEDASSLALLPHFILAQPRLEPLVRRTLGYLLYYRVHELFDSEEKRYAAATAATAIEDTSTNPQRLYSAILTPSTTQENTFRTSLQQLLQECGLDTSEDALERHCDSIEDARERDPSSARLYLVPVLRDAYDLWIDAHAVPTATDGYVWLGWRELASCLVRRSQHHLDTTLREARRRYGLVSNLDTLLESKDETLCRHHVERLHASHRSSSLTTAAAASATATASALQEFIEFVQDHGLGTVLGIGLESSYYEKLVKPLAAQALERLELIQRASTRLRARQPLVAIPEGIESNSFMLLEHAWLTMPPCYVALLTRAIERREHPKNRERIRLATFLFYAGWTLDRALSVWRHLFIYKCSYAAAGERQFREHSSYARDLESLHKMYLRDQETRGSANTSTNTVTVTGSSTRSGPLADLELPMTRQRSISSDSSVAVAVAVTTATGGPSSCARLCEQRQCPMQASKSTIVEAFNHVPDIEELILDKDDARTRCTALYHAIHPGLPGDATPISHPVSYYERALFYESVRH
jgi:hypothetical protein